MDTYPAIAVYGFPKSGNTWLHGTFNHLGRQVDVNYQQGDIHMNRSKKKKRFNVHPVVHIEDSPCIVFKSHEKCTDETFPPKDAAALGISSIEKMILIKRNPFDVLLSFLNYALFRLDQRNGVITEAGKKTLEYFDQVLKVERHHLDEARRRADVLGVFKETGACDRALRAFVDSNFEIVLYTELYGTWLEHTLSWEKQSLIPRLSIRYEDMVRDLPNEVERISTFIDVPSDLLTRAFDSQETATMQAKSHDDKKNQLSFYNQRRAGYFWNYFDNDLVNEVITENAALLDKTGYGDIREIVSRSS